MLRKASPWPKSKTTSHSRPRSREVFVRGSYGFVAWRVSDGDCNANKCIALTSARSGLFVMKGRWESTRTQSIGACGTAAKVLSSERALLIIARYSDFLISKSSRICSSGASAFGWLELFAFGVGEKFVGNPYWAAIFDVSKVGVVRRQWYEGPIAAWW